jgi:hypothetical protein
LDAFIDVLDDLERRRDTPLHVALTLREDYLGRWNGLLAGHPRLTRDSYRVGRLTVTEITGAAIKAAASATPPQLWDVDVLGSLVDGMAIPGQWKSDTAEVESAFVQIVCRVLFDRGDELSGLVVDQDQRSRRIKLFKRDEDDAPETRERRGNRQLATQILEGYLNDTLGKLGSEELATRTLLEGQLITRSEARKVVILAALEEAWTGQGDVAPILERLEQARILRAQVHRNDKFYELGHDWLAGPIRTTAEQKRLIGRRKRLRTRRLVGLVVVLVSLGIAFQASVAKKHA